MNDLDENTLGESRRNRYMVLLNTGREVLKLDYEKVYQFRNNARWIISLTFTFISIAAAIAIYLLNKGYPMNCTSLIFSMFFFIFCASNIGVSMWIIKPHDFYFLRIFDKIDELAKLNEEELLGELLYYSKDNYKQNTKVIDHLWNVYLWSLGFLVITFISGCGAIFFLYIGGV